MTIFTHTKTVLTRSKPITTLGALLTCLLLLAACASAPPPNKEINAAEQAITDADQARVAEHGMPELQEARRKLAEARAAVNKEEMEKARRLAVEARADVKLATAKAELAKAEAVNADMQKNIRILKEEMQRTRSEQQ